MRDGINRRQTLQMGAVGAAGILVGGVGLSQTGLPWTAGSLGSTPNSGRELVQPAELRSRDGVLRTELVASRTEVDIAGVAGRMLTYNGSVPGPTWILRPGDRLEVRLVNNLDEPTNVHTHGLAVSPEGNGDNPFLSIGPGENFDFRFDVPADHPTGVFWYHPHHHGSVPDQVFGGLYGTILVQDEHEAPSPRDRVLVISDVTLSSDGAVAQVSHAQTMNGREGELLLVNGQSQPLLSARPGELERWRVVNACTSRYLRLAAPGQDIWLVGMDSGHERTPRPVDDVLLAPGNRADLLVRMRRGTGELATLGYDRGRGMMGMVGSGDLSGPATLATLVVDGDDLPIDGRVSAQRIPDRDLRDRGPDNRRDITMTMGMQGMGAGMVFGFDDRPFDGERTDQSVTTGTVEEWTIRNPTTMDHPFHLHVWPMQVVEEHGRSVDEPMWRDVVNVTAGGSIKVLVDFARHPGRSVYHCHILDHEDAGMMAVVASGG
ncbi:multicopper oxidase family protein [Tessaracoccus antarcticus]|uniref:Multicopper oxidase family protein n=1 Tax=Tessaracoccus antarcticus TaxID=2479848 RepID=A0A3M0G9T3_9ACTN|nr:multicopper oxidase family protein [Tessaracoccus antarcticus]RMB61801.1 multicopper oxidase family protein [Tessaracoccus antarcticus]